MGSPSHPLTDSTQPLIRQVAATSDATGAATFTFQSPPAGFTWTGTLSCATAPIGAVFAATIGGTPWGQWGGNSVFGPIQSQYQSQLVVTATGLSASTGYVLALVGSSDPTDLVSPIWPDSNSTALQAQVTIQPSATIISNSTRSQTVPGGTNTQTTNFTFTPPSSAVALTLQISNFISNLGQVPTGGATVAIVGLTTGYDYLQPTSINAAFSSTGIYQVAFPVFANIETLQISYTTVQRTDPAQTYTWNEIIIASSSTQAESPTAITNQTYPSSNQATTFVTAPGGWGNLNIDPSGGLLPGYQLALGSVSTSGNNFRSPAYSDGLVVQCFGLTTGTTYTFQVYVSPLNGATSAITKSIVARNFGGLVSIYFPLRVNRGDYVSITWNPAGPTSVQVISTPSNTTLVNNAPGETLSTTNQGGILRFSNNVGAGVSGASLLTSITATRQAYRIHSFALGTLQSGTVGCQILVGGTDTMAFLGAQNPVQLMGGVITQAALTINNTSAAACRVTVFYDIVSYPGINLYDTA